MALLAALFLLPMAAPSSAEAQLVAPPRLLDLFQTEWLIPSGGYPPIGRFFELGSLRYFAHDDGVHGLEIWRTDGTPEGTFPIHDLCPGICAGVGPYEMAAAGGLLFFRGFDGIHGEELYVTNGTTVSLVADLQPGSRSSGPSWLLDVGDSVYFQVSDPVGRRLWKSDGTDPGTHPVEGVVGPTEHYADLGGELVFGWERRLWITTGEGAGALQLTPSDVEVYYSGLPHDWRWAISNNRFFFEAIDPIHGQEVWVSDGTPEGTMLLADLAPGGASSSLLGIRAFGTGVLIHAQTSATGAELWVSDGTPAGTTALPEIVPGSGNGAGFIVGPVAGSMLFFGYDDTHGWEPWLTDGTGGGTALLKGVRPGPEGSRTFGTGYAYGELGSKLLFVADDGEHGPEPWVTDGTTEGTEMLVDGVPGPDGSMYWTSKPSWEIGQGLFLGLSDFGWEPFVTDGTPAGTALLGNFQDQSNSIPTCLWTLCPGFAPTPEGTFFGAFSAGGPNGFLPRLHVSDGSEAGTQELPLVDDGEEEGVYRLSDWARVSEGLLFRDAGTEALVISDGAAGGTGFLRDGAQEVVTATRLVGEPIGGTALFIRDGELWRTNGAAPGTTLVPGPSPLSNEAWSLVVGSLTFVAAAGEISKVGADGTASSFVSLPGEYWWQIYLLGALGPADHPRIVFFWNDGVHGIEPWVTDGTPEGTFLLADLMPGASNSWVEYGTNRYLDRGDQLLWASNGQFVAFAAADPVGITLYVTDGTPEGTVPVFDPLFRVFPDEPRWVVPFRDGFAFQARTPAQGVELWMHDGQGHHARLFDLLPGPGSSGPRHLTEIEDELAFSAFDPDHGVELWISNGSVVGTSLAYDLNPGPGSSSPLALVAGAGQLWFAATDGIHGFEPWSVKLPTIFADGFESGGVEQWSAVGE